MGRALQLCNSLEIHTKGWYMGLFCKSDVLFELRDDQARSIRICLLRIEKEVDGLEGCSTGVLRGGFGSSWCMSFGDMYSIHGLRLMLDKMAESGSGDLDSIVKDLRRLHERLINS